MVRCIYLYLSIFLSSHVDQSLSLNKYMAKVEPVASRVSCGLGWRERIRPTISLKKNQCQHYVMGEVDQELWLHVLYITQIAITLYMFIKILRAIELSVRSTRLQYYQFQNQCLKCQNKPPFIHFSDKHDAKRIPTPKACQVP